MERNYDFKTGDQVACIFSHWGRRVERIVTVERTTSTLAVVLGTKYDRRTGREHGHKYGSRSIEPATPEVIAEYKSQNRRERRRDFLKSFLDGNWQSMGEENLDKVAIALGFESSQGASADAPPQAEKKDS